MRCAVVAQGATGVVAGEAAGVGTTVRVYGPGVDETYGSFWPFADTLDLQFQATYTIEFDSGILGGDYVAATLSTGLTLEEFYVVGVGFPAQVIAESTDDSDNTVHGCHMDPDIDPDKGLGTTAKIKWSSTLWCTPAAIAGSLKPSLLHGNTLVRDPPEEPCNACNPVRPAVFSETYDCDAWCSGTWKNSTTFVVTLSPHMVWRVWDPVRCSLSGSYDETITCHLSESGYVQ